MSCGKPHEVPCSEVLARVYSYLDGEIEDQGFARSASTWTSAVPACASTGWKRP